MERLIEVDGVELCVRTSGTPEHPAVLLVAGMSSPMDCWDDGLCELLAAAGGYVVRYDQRDTGRSTTSPPGEPGYTFSDLVEDVPGLLDALGLPTAHLVGISMGGAVAQAVALRHPERVASLTLIATTPVVPLPADSPPLDYDSDLGELPEPDWSDPASVVDHLVTDQRRLAPVGFDEARARALAERVVRRSVDVRAALTNHALLPGGEPITGSLADITAPTLVVHGTADPVFALAHGEALVREIPGATLLVVDGMGHEVPPPAAYDVVLSALLAHTAASRSAE